MSSVHLLCCVITQLLSAHMGGQPQLTETVTVNGMLTTMR